MSSEKKIIKRTLENPDAFGEIIDLYENKLNSFLLHLGVKSSDDREDLLQEIFWKTYKNLNDFDEDLKFSSWIYRIARNTTYDFFRKIKSRGQKQDFTEEVYDLFWNQLVDKSQNVEDSYDKKQRQKIVANVLQEVPEKYREVLILLYIENKSYVEISDILQKKENTIATLISRGKEKFKVLFQQKFNFSEV